MTNREFYTAVMAIENAPADVVEFAEAAIAKMDATTFIFDEEYFHNFGGMNVGEYKNGFVGITSDTWDGSAAIIATATMTSNAVKESTTDAFASFNSIKGGEQ